METQPSVYILSAPMASMPTHSHAYLKRLNETENYGQEWPSPPFYTPTAVSTDNGVEYALYDASHPVTTDSRNLYETVNSTSNLPSSSGSYANNFGAVLYSSLTTLSNGTDHVNAEQGSTNLVYSGNDAVGDPNYLSNVPSNVSSSDCFYSGYMEEFNMTDVAVTSSHPQQFGYSQAHQAQPAQPIASGFVANSTQPSISHFSGTSISNEDCFDKSSDSAVSSMSSDRVHSYSDNEWVETSSESSSYNGENNLTDYQHTDKSNTSAQKKYRLFGKSKQGEIKNATQSQNYYVDYSQMSTYIYPSSCPVNNSASSGEHYTALDYYQAGVLHNHTYAQPTELPSLSSISSTLSTSNEWSASENSDDKQSDTSRSFKTSSSKKLQEGSSQQKKDYHLNRDEKKARHLKIPISTHDIINLPIDEFNERLTKYELTDVQLSLIRDIRRRGKNKVAAQNCRKRKLDQIMGLQTEVDCMFSQKETLENQYNQLVMLREMARDKYTKLYQFVVEASSSRQPFFELTATPPDFPDKDSSREVHLTDSSGSSFLVSSNLSSLPITSYGVPNDFIKSED